MDLTIAPERQPQPQAQWHVSRGSTLQSSGLQPPPPPLRGPWEPQGGPSLPVARQPAFTPRGTADQQWGFGGSLAVAGTGTQPQSPSLGSNSSIRPPPLPPMPLLSCPPSSRMPAAAQAGLTPSGAVPRLPLTAAPLTDVDQTRPVPANGTQPLLGAAGHMVPSDVASQAGLRRESRNTAYGTGTGPASSLPAASPEELCVELLEALVRRGGGPLTATRPASSSSSAASRILASGRNAGRATPDSDGSGNGAAGVSHAGAGTGMGDFRGVRRKGELAPADAAEAARGTVDEMPVAPPLPARVLANAVWAGVRLLVQVWPRLQPGPGLGPWSEPAAPPLRLRQRAMAALRALLARVPATASSLEPQHVSNLLYSVAQLAARAPEVLKPPTEDGVEANGGGSGGFWGVAAAETGLTAAAGGEAVAAGEGLGSAGLPRVGPWTRQLVAALLDASLLQLPGFGPQALSNSLYAIAVLGISPPRPWLQAWLAAASAQLIRADPQHVANMLWALARLNCNPGDPWVLGALQAAALKAPAFTTEGLCITLWAVAKLGFSTGGATQARALVPLLVALEAAARECDGHDVANGMWALARLHIQLLPPVLPPLLQTGKDGSAAPVPPAPHIAPYPIPGSMVPIEAAPSPQPTRTQAPAVLHDTLLAAGRRLLAASSRHLRTYNSQQLANTAWAAAALGLQPPPEWAVQFWPAARAALPAMRTEELVATAMSSARMRLQPPDEWLAAVLKLTGAAMRQGEALPPDAAAAAPAAGFGDDGEGGSGAGGTTVLGGNNGGLQHRVKFRAQATGRALASLLWCVEAWGVRLPVAWTARVLRRLEALAEGGALEPAALATSLQAMARMGLRPDAVVAGWTVRVVEDCVASAEALAEGVAGEGGARVGPVGRCVLTGSEVGKRGGADEHVGSGRSPAAPPVGCLDARCARMLLWSLARLRCPVSDGIAGVLALKASSDCDDSTALAAGGGDGAAEGEEVVAARRRKAARSVCVVLWALACLSCRPSVEVMRKLARRAAQHVAWASESELLSMVRSFAAMGFRPGARFQQAVEWRAVQLAPALSGEQAAALLACCSRLR